MTNASCFYSMNTLQRPIHPRAVHCFFRCASSIWCREWLLAVTLLLWLGISLSRKALYWKHRTSNEFATITVSIPCWVQCMYCELEIRKAMSDQSQLSQTHIEFSIAFDQHLPCFAPIEWTDDSCCFELINDARCT